MILTDKGILAAMQNGGIVITPFDKKCLGSNSYDVHLSAHLAEYENYELDAKKHNKIKHLTIPPEGIMLYPEKFYLGSTIEYTETHHYVPFLEGKSSTGRLGISIHATAGKGDVGFCNHWTLEISVKQPCRVYEGMPIGQIIYFVTNDETTTPYHQKSSAKYTQKDILPVESMMWKNFPSTQQK